MYKRFGKEVEFKRYLHGVGDAETRLLFKFRSRTHGLNEGSPPQQPSPVVVVVVCLLYRWTSEHP